MIKPLPNLRKNDSNLKKVKRVRPEAKVGGPYVTTGFKKVDNEKIQIVSIEALLSCLGSGSNDPKGIASMKGLRHALAVSDSSCWQVEASLKMFQLTT